MLPSVRAAIEMPALFKRLFLVEAMICPMDTEKPIATDGIEMLTRGAIQRRDGWSSR